MVSQNQVFRQIVCYLAELFRQIVCYLAELFRQIAFPIFMSKLTYLIALWGGCGVSLKKSSKMLSPPERGKLFGGTVPPNNTLFGGTVPPNNNI